LSLSRIGCINIDQLLVIFKSMYIRAFLLEPSVLVSSRWLCRSPLCSDSARFSGFICGKHKMTDGYITCSDVDGNRRKRSPDKLTIILLQPFPYPLMLCLVFGSNIFDEVRNNLHPHSNNQYIIHLRISTHPIC